MDNLSFWLDAMRREEESQRNAKPPRHPRNDYLATFFITVAGGVAVLLIGRLLGMA